MFVTSKKNFTIKKKYKQSGMKFTVERRSTREVGSNDYEKCGSYKNDRIIN